MSSSAPEGQGPAWAELPVDLWRRIALAASHGSDSYNLEHAAAWLDGIRLCSTMSMVSRAMREAVTGTGADALWYRPRFSSGTAGVCHPGLTQQQTQGLNRLQAQRCRALGKLHVLLLQSGGWVPADLREVCSSLPRETEIIYIEALHDAGEAEIIGAALAGASYTLQGSPAQCLLPCLAACCSYY